VFNVNALTSLAVLADRLGVDLWHYQTPDGRSLRKALDYLAPYTDPAHKWPGNQANAFNAGGLAAPLLRARAAYGPDAFADALKHLPPDDLARLRVRLTINPTELSCRNDGCHWSAYSQTCALRTCGTPAAHPSRIQLIRFLTKNSARRLDPYGVSPAP
jgi:hypothetical protein